MLQNILLWAAIIFACFVAVIVVCGIYSWLTYDAWKDTMMDEAEMLDAEDEAREMEKGGWDRQKCKQQCRYDIETGWRRPAAARYLYGTEIFEEVRKEMLAQNVKPGSRPLLQS